MLQGAVAWPPDVAARYRALGLWQGETIAAWFESRATRFAERVAVIDGAVRVTYRELRARVDGLARGLTALGILPRDRVVLQLPNGLALVEALLALSRVGAIPVLALPAHRRTELQAFCERTTARAFLFAPKQGGADLLSVALELRRACRRLELLVGSGPPSPHYTSLDDLRASIAPLPALPLDASEVALLQLSGGSTGVPKLIARSHDDYLYSVRESAALCQLSEQTRFLAALPMTHNFTLSSPGVLGVLHAGGVVVSCAHPSPEAVLQQWAEERITLVAAVPSLVRSWLDSPALRRFPELLLQVGGAKLDEALARRALETWGCRLQQVFGMAEGLVNYTRLEDEQDLVCTTQGRPLSAFDEVRVVSAEDPEGPEVAAGDVGELQTRGPYTIRGYYGGVSPGSFTQEGYYRTGDLVQRRPDGYLNVVGRLGDRILRGGEKISPLEVEDHLRAHPAVTDVAVVGLPDALLGEKSHAFVTLLRPDGSLTAAVARAFLRQRGLADFKLPDAVHVVAELPRTKVGKTDRAALRSSRLGA